MSHFGCCLILGVSTCTTRYRIFFSKWGLWFRGTSILRLWEIGTAIILQKTCCLYTILAGFDLVLRLVLWAHHCLRRPSGGPAGGYCRSSADPVACGAPRASAAKDGCTFLACGALFRTNNLFLLRSRCMYLFTKKNSDEIVRYPRCIPPWNSMIATNSAIETSRST